MSQEAFERRISDMLYQHQRELLAMGQQWTDRQNNYLHRIHWEIMQFNRCWEESKGEVSALAHEEAANLEDGSRSFLIPEALGSLTMLLFSQHSFERLMTGDIPVEALPHTTAIRLGGEILLNKLNEAVDQYKNLHLKTAQQGLNMAIELESGALIDGMLDKAIELKMLSDNGTDLQKDCLEEVHATVLRLNHYWQVLDAQAEEDMRLIRRSVALLNYLIQFLQLYIREEPGLSPLSDLQKTLRIIESKVTYLVQKITFDLD